MQSTRDIKNRINSVKNTKKITHTMEMIAGVKMRKAIEDVLKIRDYAYYNWKILATLIRSIKDEGNKEINYFLRERSPKKVLMLVITSNRGLCGPFNSLLMDKVKKHITSLEQEGAEKIDLIGIGKKSNELLKKLKFEVIDYLPELTETPTINNLYPLSQQLFNYYEVGTYDRISMAITDFKNSLFQLPSIYQLMPIKIEELISQIEDIDKGKHEKTQLKGDSITKQDYLIEPNPERAFEVIYPHLTAARIFHGILESNASVESARMLAMKNATDTAGEMIDDLTLKFNKLRQAKITQEISEISASIK